MKAFIDLKQYKEILKILSFRSFFLALTYIVRFLLTFSLVRILSQEDFGYYSWVMSTIMLFSTLNIQGLDNYTLRKIAELKHDSKEKTMRFQYFVRSTILKNSAWNLVFLFFIFLIVQNTELLGDMSINFSLLAIYALSLPFSSLTMVNASTLRVNDYPRIAQIGDSFIQSSSLVVLVLFTFYFLEVNLSTYYIIYLSICSWVISFLFTSYFHRKFNLPSKSFGKTSPSEWKKESLQIMLGVFGWVILSRGDVFILGFFVPSSELSSYFVSLRIAEVMLFLPSVCTYIWAGRVSNLFHEGNLIETQRILKLSSRLSFAMSFILFAFGYFFSTEILNIFGEFYSTNTSILRWSLFSYLIISAVGIVGPMLLIVGQQKFLAILQWSLGLSFMICIIIIAPIYGIQGGVMLFCFFQLLASFMMVLKLKKITTLSTFQI